ncbi:hypothetical protein [Streptomyces sp. NPDC006691]|uniref:hypothetical protein n=1 Tax=Streptomyces sp. NPDC006691 TaxID=3364757 RepID=UPI0036BFB7D9
MGHVVARRPAPGVRRARARDALTTVRGDGAEERRRVAAAALAGVLSVVFDIVMD